jgi:NAD(P) transhydrogenase subunit alpha
VTTFAMDLMPRITRAQRMDVLSSQATVAGYQAVLLAAAALPRMFPLLMTAAGTIPPARVLVLGAGVAGLQAIATARRLGARVEANDIRSAVKEQVESLGATFVDTGAPPEAETRTGYAKETTHEYLQKQRQILTEHMSQADVVITTALIPGRKAPVLITADMVKAMGPASIIVDLAVEMGGNVEGSVVNERVTVGGVTIIGDANLPAQVPGDASRMFARNINAFLGELIAEGAITVNKENEVIVGTLVTHAGEICHQGSAEALATKGASPAADETPDKPSAEDASSAADEASPEAPEAPETAPNDEGSTAKGAS